MTTARWARTSAIALLAMVVVAGAWMAQHDRPPRSESHSTAAADDARDRATLAHFEDLRGCLAAAGFDFPGKAEIYRGSVRLAITDQETFESTAFQHSLVACEEVLQTHPTSPGAPRRP